MKVEYTATYVLKQVKLKVSQNIFYFPENKFTIEKVQIYRYIDFFT